jgi:hypothetical protein
MRCASPPGQRRRLLAERDVAEADLLQDLQPVVDAVCALKYGTASSTVIASTSAIDLSRNLISSVSRL